MAEMSYTGIFPRMTSGRHLVRGSMLSIGRCWTISESCCFLSATIWLRKLLDRVRHDETSRSGMGFQRYIASAELYRHDFGRRRCTYACAGAADANRAGSSDRHGDSGPALLRLDGRA